MKTLGKKSLSAILAKAINVIWWIEWTGFIILVTVGIIVAIVQKTFAVNIPVTFSEVTLKQVRPLTKGLPSGILNTTSGNLYLHVNATWQHVAMLLIGFSLVFSVIALITYQLKIIFSNLKKDVPFTEVNISGIRNIAVVLMIYAVVQWLFVIVVNQMLMANFQWEHIELTYSFNISCLATGVLLIVVAEIFKLGTLLDNESKLTI